MNVENAIEVKNLYIKYKFLKSVNIKTPIKKLKLSRSKVVDFVALKDISFSVKKGEIVGVLGNNGSGKSTLLRAIAGVFSPDSGTIELNTDKVSLLAIGVGFQKKLSGRQNIILTGLLLGFSEEFIKSKENEIIEFSELGSFIDAPVKTYSSGMFSKLAFSIAAILETDILLVDEVLSVGDAKFRKKSFKKMKELIQSSERTVIIVSHNLEKLKTLCTSALWIHNGEFKMYGDAKEVIPAYEKFLEQ